MKNIVQFNLDNVQEIKPSGLSTHTLIVQIRSREFRDVKMFTKYSQQTKDIANRIETFLIRIYVSWHELSRTGLFLIFYQLYIHA